MQDPLRHYPGYVLRRASSATMAEFARRMDAIELRTVEATILQIVADNPGISQSAIGRMLDIQRANMTPIAARLEARGLVERLPSDGRSLGLKLTDAGRAKSDQARAAIDSFEAEVVARIPEAHRAHVLPALLALWDAFDA